MDFKKLSDTEFFAGFERAVRTERKITHLVLLFILEAEDRKLYAVHECDSMFKLLTKKLGYSEPCANERLQAARLLRKVPELETKLENGSINLTQATQVQRYLNEQNKKGIQTSAESALQIIEQIENKTGFETQKVLAVTFDLPIKAIEAVKPQKDESVRLELTLTKEQFEDLRDVRNLLSHICHDGSWSSVIGYLAKDLKKRKLQGRTKMEVKNDNHDENNSREKKSTVTSTQNLSQRLAVKSENASKLRRKYISIKTKRMLFEKLAINASTSIPTLRKDVLLSFNSRQIIKFHGHGLKTMTQATFEFSAELIIILLRLKWDFPGKIKSQSPTKKTTGRSDHRLELLVVVVFL